MRRIEAARGAYALGALTAGSAAWTGPQVAVVAGHASDLQALEIVLRSVGQM